MRAGADDDDDDDDDDAEGGTAEEKVEGEGGAGGGTAEAAPARAGDGAALGPAELRRGGVAMRSPIAVASVAASRRLSCPRAQLRR